MGLLPVYHANNSSNYLTFFNWGILGVIGSVAGILLAIRKSDYVEVGNTAGKKELWRAIHGLGLGLMAGILSYWMIAGGLFETGSIVPTLNSGSPKDAGLSILWAVASGFSFEKIFDRMISTTIGSSE